MNIGGINAFAVLAAAVAALAVGMIWYSPALFRAQWVALSGIDHQQMADVMGLMYGMAGLLSLLTATILAAFICWLNAGTVRGGLIIGALAWLGFVFPAHAATAIWVARPVGLLLIEAGNDLFGLVAMGIILGKWGLVDHVDRAADA